MCEKLLVASLLLVVRPGAPSSVLVPSSDALCSVRSVLCVRDRGESYILVQETGPALVPFPFIVTRGRWTVFSGPGEGSRQVTKTSKWVEFYG